MPLQLSLKVLVVDMGTTKTMQFPSDMTIHDACHDIRQKLGEVGGGVDHGLFWPEHLKWLAPGKTFEYYDIKSGENMEFKKRHRLLRVKTTDETLKTILIDETLTVAELVVAICERIGIANPEEYSLMPDLTANLGPGKDGTVRKKSAKDHEESRWLNPEKTLPEQHIKDSDVLFLKKKFFFSDQNIDRNDPIQLNLLYNQSVSAIVGGKHPCTYDEACLFAAIQCQVQHGNHAPDKHKPGFLK